MELLVASGEAMLDINEFRALDFIREQGQATRAEVAASVGLSQPSVSRLVTKLIDLGLIRELGRVETSRGRPSRVLAYNSQLGAVMAFDVGGTKIHAALADLAGTTLHERVSPTLERGDAYSTLLGAIRAMEAEATSRAVSIWAMAVGVPALIDPETGRIVAAPNVGWFDLDLNARLAADSGTPCVIQNDVNLAALGQAWKGAGRGVRCSVTVSIGTGIGAGIVVDGKLLEGKGGAAGEIGYLVVASHQLHAAGAGALGAFESIAGGRAIARRALELLSLGSAASELDPDGVTPERVLEAAQRGDAIARRVVEELLDNVAIALIAITAVLSPDRIILDGGVGRALEPWIDRLRERLAPRLLVVPELLISRLGSNSTVAGGIAAALALAHRQWPVSRLHPSEQPSAGAAGLATLTATTIPLSKEEEDQA
jgi:glucokinase